MTQSDKELLIKDLCARLPYKPRVRYYYSSIGSAAINGYSDEGYLSYQNLEDFSIYPKYGLEKTRVYNISPYLRPMSSMTEEENTEMNLIIYSARVTGEYFRITEYYNKNHLDHHNLIGGNLALEAPEDMYKI